MSDKEISKMFQQIDRRQVSAGIEMFYMGVLVGLFIGLAAASAIVMVWPS